MACAYSIDPERRLGSVTLSGTVTGVDIADTIRNIYRDSAWQAGFDIYWDCSGITQLLMEKDDQRGFVELHRAHANVATGRDIIVVTRPLDYAMAMGYAAFMKHESRRVHVCRSTEEASVLLATC